ncbi:hypothetical protein BH11ACT6_BH11ACT6_03590 [soil metagenome]
MNIETSVSSDAPAASTETLVAPDTEPSVPVAPVPAGEPGDDGATTPGGPTMVLLLTGGFLLVSWLRRRRRRRSAWKALN